MAAAAISYFVYFKQLLSPQPGQQEEELDRNKEFFSEEFLAKLGHPEKYIYAYGVVKEINASEKTILIESGSSGSFLGVEPRPQEVQMIHVIIKDSTELSKMAILNEIVSDDYPIPKTEVSQITFQDIKQGDKVSVAILPEQAERLDYFEAERFQIQNNAGQ